MEASMFSPVCSKISRPANRINSKRVSSKMAFFLGFDAGGTKTTCALADDNRILVRAIGVSFEEARQNMRALLDDVAQQSRVDLRTVAASCIGTAGVRLPQTQQWMRDILSPCAGGEITVVG